MSDTQRRPAREVYKRGVGHVLAEGHDAFTCTACAYAAGYADAKADEARNTDTEE